MATSTTWERMSDRARRISDRALSLAEGVWLRWLAAEKLAAEKLKKLAPFVSTRILLVTMLTTMAATYMVMVFGGFFPRHPLVFHTVLPMAGISAISVVLFISVLHTVAWDVHDCTRSSGKKWSGSKACFLWCAAFILVIIVLTVVKTGQVFEQSVGLLYVPFDAIGLEVIGYALAVLATAFITTCMGCCFWCTCCCGRSRVARRLREAAVRQEPFLDLVENRAVDSYATPLIFLLTFALPSIVALSGSALVGPELVLPDWQNAREVARLEPMCATTVFSAMKRAAEELGGDAALHWAVVHRLWDESLMDISGSCFRNAPLDVVRGGGNMSSDLFGTVRLDQGEPAEPLRFTVRDANRMPVAHQRVVAQMVGFSGRCEHEGAQPVLLAADGLPAPHDGPIAMHSDEMGLVLAAVRVDADGCGGGWMEVAVWTDPSWPAVLPASPPPPPVTTRVIPEPGALRQTLWLWLHVPASPSPSSEVRSQPAVVHRNDSIVTTTVVTRSNLTGVEEETTVNTTRFPPCHTEGGDAANATTPPCRTLQTSTTRRRAVPALTYLTRPPASVPLRETFTVRLMLHTDQGLPISGKKVLGVLVADRGSRGRLQPGSAAVTDADGTATLHMRFEAGVTGNYTILFLADHILEVLQSEGGSEALAVQRIKQVQDSLTATLAAGLAAADLEEILQEAVDDEVERRTEEVRRRVRMCHKAPIAEQQQCISRAMQQQPSLAPSGVARPEFQGPILDALRDSLRDSMQVALSSLLPEGMRFDRPPSGEEAAQLVRRAVDALSRSLPVPPPATVWLQNDVAAHLTAPFRGYSLSDQSYAGHDGGMNYMSPCMLLGIPRFVTSRSAGPNTFNGGASVPFPTSGTFSKSGAVGGLVPLVPVLQPWPFSSANFFLDADGPSSMSCKRGGKSYVATRAELPQPRLPAACRRRLTVELPQWIAEGWQPSDRAEVDGVWKPCAHVSWEKVDAMYAGPEELGDFNDRYAPYGGIEAIFTLFDALGACTCPAASARDSHDRACTSCMAHARPIAP